MVVAISVAIILFRSFLLLFVVIYSIFYLAINSTPRHIIPFPPHVLNVL